MLRYEIMNPPDFSKKSKDGKFIYVLMFNVDDDPLRPFYVGQTSRLTRRFNAHEMLIWHLARFDRPAWAYIAGEVPKLDADAAEQDLIARLSRAGYSLINTTITDRGAKRIQRGLPAVRVLGREELRQYLHRPKPKVLDGWREQWARPARRFVEIGSQLTTSEVVSYVSSLTYPSKEVRNVSVAIAQLHDSELGYSNIVLSDELKGTPGFGKLHKHLRKLKEVWYFNAHVRPGQPHQFRLTKKHLAKLSASRRENTAVRN